MDEADKIAAAELASEMRWPDAVKFLRSECGVGLRECIYWAQMIAAQYPLSIMAKSLPHTN